MLQDERCKQDTFRIESWAGEVRVNLLRLAGIVVFYANHLCSVYLVAGAQPPLDYYHSAVTAIVVAWSTIVIALHLCLSRRWAPWWLKYAATFADILLITCLLVVGRDPESRIAILFFLVIAAAPLRLSLRLVQSATLAIMAVFMIFQTYAWWNWRPRADDIGRAVPGQVLFLLALGAAGLMAGQVVRQAQRIVHGYPVTVAKKEDA